MGWVRICIFKEVNSVTSSSMEGKVYKIKLLLFLILLGNIMQISTEIKHVELYQRETVG